MYSTETGTETWLVLVVVPYRRNSTFLHLLTDEHGIMASGDNSSEDSRDARVT